MLIADCCLCEACWPEAVPFVVVVEVAAGAADAAGFCVQLPALTLWAELTGSMLPLAGQ